MSANLTEAERRAALFGRAVATFGEPTQQPPQIKLPSAPRQSGAKRLSSRLRVTLHVTKEFEGVEEVFVHDANPLSTLISEGEAKAAAKRKKYRYFDVISVIPVQV